MENLYLIVGLGNPGADYARTRHNAGFMAVERLAARCQAGWSFDDKFDARLAKVERDDRRLMLCQPQRYMNASGEVVGKLKEYFRVPLTHLLVVVDDADLPVGVIRLGPRGSSGGHHGLESIEQHLGTRVYPRLRIGIGRTESSGREITGHVLGRFAAPERRLFEKVLDRAAGQLECWLDHGIQKAMSQYNGAVENSGEKDQ
jgi:peptidyl-tRNA hydrolase, PTH1 family